jgi:predicted glycogen debranching enzyme
MPIELGPAVCGDLDDATRREWLVADGTGGYAMGTVAGLRTRRYHGLLVVADRVSAVRHLALAALDPALVLGDERVRLGTFEWQGGVVDPLGHVFLTGFSLTDGVPTRRYQVGGTVIEEQLAMAHGRPAVAVSYRLIAGSPIRLELGTLCTWRDANGERFAGADPQVEQTADGFVFERHYAVKGPGYVPAGEWYRGARAREEAARGLNDVEDLWFGGRFTKLLEPGDTLGVTAWSTSTTDPGPAELVIDAARHRARALIATAKAASEPERLLTLAADQFIIRRTGAPAPDVIAGYPWFNSWSRDTMLSYEGLFLATGRIDEGRALLREAAGTISGGMLANTADGGPTEYNTIDATLWFLHAIARHVEASGDLDLAAELAGPVDAIVAAHIAGTRYGIRVDPADGLLTGGAAKVALTWMDARIDGMPVTQRAGKPVEVNALWISGLRGIGRLTREYGGDAAVLDALAARAEASFVRRFVRPDGGGLFDVVDAPDDDATVRPNQVLAVSLPDGPLKDHVLASNVVRACAPLLTPLGLRSLDPADGAYRGLHRGDPATRDRAYHEGTVWPWLIGPFNDASRHVHRDDADALGPLIAHLGEWGLGSVSETLDGDAPHHASGCPFQAWSVAELLRQVQRRSASV